MALYLDCEFNGHCGRLISMALASTEGDHWYGIWPMDLATINPWVVEHVMPVLNVHPTSLRLNLGDEFTAAMTRASLHTYLERHAGEIIYADWPADFEHLMHVMAGDSYEQSWMVDIGMQLLKATDPKPEVPHNALSDAVALMRWHVANRGAVKHICRACGGLWNEDLRVGTADSDVNVLAPPYCSKCGMNRWGNKS